MLRIISSLISGIVLAAMLTSCQTGKTVQEEKYITAAKINGRLGMAYLQRHDLYRAKQKFLLALDEAPGIPESWYSMAYFLEVTGNKAHAKEYYLKAVALAPERGDVLNNYGTFLCRSGDYSGAVTQFLKAVHDPKYLESSAAYENAGLCAKKIANNSTLAIEYFEKAAAEDGSRPTAYIELASLNYDQGNYDLAKAQLRKYLSLTAPTGESYLLEQKLENHSAHKIKR